MSSDQSVFTFELNETLYFERGQEVEELRGISLDPEITIQALDDYISITGVIELNGNYHKVATSEDSQEISDFSSEIKRFIENVEETNETEAEFTHRFPVEISVPTYRVASLDDVAVSVESFDYELPNNSQLKLYSTIAIHGINQEVAREEEVAQEEGQEEDALELEEDTDTVEELISMEREEEETFEFEIKEQQEEDTNQEVEPLSQIDTPVLSDDREESEEKVEVEEEPNVEETKEGRWSFKTQSQSLSEFFANQTDLEVDDEDSDAIDVEVDEVDDSRAEIVYENRTDSQDEKDITYLSDIFREADEEEFTKIRVCIVQKDDTIETISERFEVSPLQVIKQNQLEDDFDVSEGQILYIPTKK